MKKDLDEIKGLIEVKQNIFEKIANFFKSKFVSNEKEINSLKIRTFEEKLLTKEEQEEKKREREEDRKLAEYYRSLMENADIELEVDEDVPEDDAYIWDEDFEAEETTEDNIKKDEFFQIYESIKNGTESVDNLSIKELLKVELMLKSEINMKLEKIDSQDALKLEQELQALEEENRILTEELKKLEENN